MTIVKLDDVSFFDPKADWPIVERTLIRSPEQFEHYRRYIADNPKRAELSAGMYRHFQKELTQASLSETRMSVSERLTCVKGTIS
jgi:hypothetical protein